jgi:hypothetical protein
VEDAGTVDGDDGERNRNGAKETVSPCPDDDGQYQGAPEPWRSGNNRPIGYP